VEVVTVAAGGDLIAEARSRVEAETRAAAADATTGLVVDLTRLTSPTTGEIAALVCALRTPCWGRPGLAIAAAHPHLRDAVRSLCVGGWPVVTRSHATAVTAVREFMDKDTVGSGSGG
jgi:hypothetical protein